MGVRCGCIRRRRSFGLTFNQRDVVENHGDPTILSDSKHDAVLLGEGASQPAQLQDVAAGCYHFASDLSRCPGQRVQVPGIRRVGLGKAAIPLGGVESIDMATPFEGEIGLRCDFAQRSAPSGLPLSLPRGGGRVGASTAGIAPSATQAHQLPVRGRLTGGMDQGLRARLCGVHRGYDRLFRKDFRGVARLSHDDHESDDASEHERLRHVSEQLASSGRVASSAPGNAGAWASSRGTVGQHVDLEDRVGPVYLGVAGGTKKQDIARENSGEA